MTIVACNADALKVKSVRERAQTARWAAAEMADKLDFSAEKAINTLSNKLL